MIESGVYGSGYILMFLKKIKKIFNKKKANSPKKYLSCEYIQHGFNVDYSDIKMCCFNCHEGGGRQILVDNYNGGKINWKKFFAEKRQMRELNKQGITLEKCKGCIFLKEREWDDEDYIDYMVFNHWTKCNCKCMYCFTEGGWEHFNTRENYNMYEVIKELADKKLLRAGGEIGFGGGEPAILEEFEPMVNLFLDYGLDNIRVHSSGIKYSPAIARGIAEGKLNVVISVDAGTDKTYKAVKRVPCFDKVWENIRKYAQAQTDDKGLARTKYIIIPGVNDTVEELDKWFELTIDAGVRWIVLDIEAGWYGNNKDNIPQHVYDLLEYGIHRSKELGMINCELYDRASHMKRNKKEESFEV